MASSSDITASPHSPTRGKRQKSCSSRCSSCKRKTIACTSTSATCRAIPTPSSTRRAKSFITHDRARSSIPSPNQSTTHPNRLPPQQNNKLSLEKHPILPIVDQGCFLEEGSA